jgi:uncharacterized protein
MNDPISSPDVTQDDKLWAALGYPFFPVAIIMLLMEQKKNRPFIRYHAIQALGFSVVLFVVSFALSLTAILACITPFLWLVSFWPAYEAYQGKYMELPGLTAFLKKQGWI